MEESGSGDVGRGPGLLHRVGALGKSLLPRSLWQPARSVLSAAITPFLFSYHSGHFRSALTGRSIDRFGHPIPWYTYPAVGLLASKDFTGRRVLEFGGGMSTCWWAERCEQVVCFEHGYGHDTGAKGWFERLARMVPANVRLVSTDRELTRFDEQLAPGELFDVVVVDGLSRLRAARCGLEHLAPAGVLIFDNSDGYWGKDGTYPVLDLLREEGLSRVDFHGHVAVAASRSCTSMAFRPGCFLFLGLENVARPG